MADFQVGDRVRVLATPGTALDAGRAGTVVRVSRPPDGAVYAHHVGVDGSTPGAAGVRLVFTPHELEPETP